jgi:hypothetical protein
MNRFPDELVDHLFGFLPPSTQIAVCRYVCEQWRRVVDARFHTRYLGVKKMPPISCLFDALLDEYPDEKEYIERKRHDTRAASFHEALFYLHANHPKEVNYHQKEVDRHLGAWTIKELLWNRARMTVRPSPYGHMRD